MADACLPAIGVEVSAEGVGRHYGARKDGGLLDGWLIHDADTASVPGVAVRAVPLLMTDDSADGVDGPRRDWSSAAVTRPRGRRGSRSCRCSASANCGPATTSPS